MLSTKPEHCPHCADLEEQVAYLKSELGVALKADKKACLMRKYGLTPGEATVLATLYASNRVMKSELIEEHLDPSDLREGAKIVDVYVCRLRKKLGGEIIETIWGAGKRLTPAGRSKVEAALA